MSSVELDAELQRLRSDAATREGLEPQGYAWERQRDRRDRDGSYVELERCWNLLGIGDRSVLGTVYDSGLVGKVSGSYLQRESTAVIELSRLMRGRIRVPKWAYPEIRELRVSWVKRLDTDGWSIREIGKELDLSQRYVKGVLSK